ncbi:MAG: CarD family transcriptional regulator [Blastocatellia bacterium]
MEFKVGQKVVYPNHGVATIEQIESRQIAGTQQEFYLLRLQINNSTVMVPVQNVLAIGIRRLILQRQCQDLLMELCARFPFPSARDWKDRFREFSDVMRRGDVFAIAQVLKTLTYLNQLKPLSFREKQMMEKARYLIVSELAVVSKKPETNVGPQVDEAVAESMRVPAP